LIFEKIPTVPMADELVDKAFRRASRAGRGKTRDRRGGAESMIMTASNILSDNLIHVVKRFPNLDDLPPFYRDLTDILVGVDKLKMSLASVHWAGNKVREVSKDHIGKLRKGQDPSGVRKEAFGRIASIVREVGSDLAFLNDARDKLRKLPEVSEIPTIVVAGYPNVGKSSFVAAVSSAKPEVAEYPFTTKGVSIGHFMHERCRYQVIDLPGLLDRPLSERNKIELQAISALRHLGDVVLFILDPSETCGYSLASQKHLLEEIKSELKVPVLVVANKSDLTSDLKKVETDMLMSAGTGKGVAEVKARLIEILKECRRPSNQP